jgi:hypothetical protein
MKIFSQVAHMIFDMETTGPPAFSKTVLLAGSKKLGNGGGSNSKEKMDLAEAIGVGIVSKDNWILLNGGAYKESPEEDSTAVIDDKNYIQNNLAFSFEAHKALNEYNRDVVQTVIAKELLAEDKYIGAGEIYQYYKIKPINYKDENGKNKQKKFTIYPDKYELDLDIYREGLFNCVKNILDLFDLNVVDLEQELVKKK